MSELVINPIEHENQRVLTTTQLAKGYETDSQIIVNNYNRNRDRYQVGKHYYALKGEEKRNFINQHQIDLGLKNAATIYLWTEKGALLHAKSLNTDQAWEVYDQLVETYFRAKEMFAIPKTLPEALRYAAELAEQVEKQKPLVAFAETAAQSKDSVLIRELAKICCKNGIETGEKRLYRILREWGMIMNGSTEPYQRFIDCGYFEVIEGTHERNNGIGIHRVTRVLPKGQIYIMNRLKGA